MYFSLLTCITLVFCHCYFGFILLYHQCASCDLSCTSVWIFFFKLSHANSKFNITCLATVEGESRWHGIYLDGFFPLQFYNAKSASHIYGELHYNYCNTLNMLLIETAGTWRVSPTNTHTHTHRFQSD